MKININNKDEALKLLKDVEKLAAEGNNQKQIAEILGVKTTFTLNNWLVKASQVTGRGVPPFKQNRKGKGGMKVIEKVEVKRRGKGTAFGVNVPQEPLMRAGFKPGDKLTVTVRGKKISLQKAD